MTPAQENELIRTVRMLRKEVSELRDLVSPIAPSKDEILTVKQAADFLKFSNRKIYRLVEKNRIPFSKKESRIKFSKNALLVWLNQ